MKGGTDMFDVLGFARDHDIEVTVRPGRGRVVYELFLRDRAHDLVEFSQIMDYNLTGIAKVDQYIEDRCNRMMDKIKLARVQAGSVQTA